MDLITRYPSAVAVLRIACTLHTCGDDPQHAGPFVAEACRFAEAAEALDAPASVELPCVNALEVSLGADSAYLAFVAVIDEPTRRRMDLDLFLQDFHAWR